MLAVAVNDSDVRTRACQHSFYTCRGKAPPTDALKAAYSRILPRDFPDLRRRSVSRIVVYENHFPRFSTKALLEPPDEFQYVVSLIEGWYDHGELGNRHVRGNR